MPFDPENVLCMAHLCTVTWKGSVPVLILGRRDIHGSKRELRPLFEALSYYETHGIQCHLHQTQRNDAILVLKGGVSPYISDSDPMMVGRSAALVQPLRANPEPAPSRRTAQALNRYLSHCHTILCRHEINRCRVDQGRAPGNFLTTLRCGRQIIQASFYDRWGLRGMLMASGGMYKGPAGELSLEFRAVQDSENPGRDLEARMAMALEDPDHDFIHVHTKAPDEAGHTGDPKHKADEITGLDQGLDELIGAVEARDDLVVAVTADHSTPSRSALIHSGEGVPVTLVGPTVRRDQVSVFDEISAAAGCLRSLRGSELMHMMLNYADRSALMGQRLGKRERPYVPEDYAPFAMNPSTLDPLTFQP